MRRRAHKIDESQPDIVERLEAVGAKVYKLSSIGGPCDLLVRFRTTIFLMEIKNPGPPSSQRFTDRELDFARLFPVHVVTTPEEALAVIGVEVAA